VSFVRSWRLGGGEGDRRAVAAQHELRRSDRSTVLAVGTLACDRCDAPIAPGDARLRPADLLTCPYCLRRAPVREFLSLASPTRPARVIVRVTVSAAPAR
jgi:hypothetical protein